MSNQCPFEVEQELSVLLSVLAAEFSAEVIVGIPTLGLNYARNVARNLGFPDYVASAAAAIELVQSTGAQVIGLCVVLIEGEAWKTVLEALAPDWPDRIRGLGRLPLFRSTAAGWVPVI